MANPLAFLPGLNLPFMQERIAEMEREPSALKRFMMVMGAQPGNITVPSILSKDNLRGTPHSSHPTDIEAMLTGKPVYANEYDGQKRSVASVAQESAPAQPSAREPRNAIEAAAMKTGLMDQLAKRMREAAGAEAGVGEANAADALAVAKALRGGDMEQKFADQLAAQEKFKERPKLERLADAILQGGGWLDVRSKNPIGAAAQNYSKVSDADEAKFEKKQEKEMKNFLTRMGFAKEDVAALNAKDAMMLAARQGGRAAPLAKSKTEAAIAEAMLGQSNKERQFSLEGQKIGAMRDRVAAAKTVGAKPVRPDANILKFIDERAAQLQQETAKSAAPMSREVARRRAMDEVRAIYPNFQMAADSDAELSIDGLY